MTVARSPSSPEDLLALTHRLGRACALAVGVLVGACSPEALAPVEPHYEDAVYVDPSDEIYDTKNLVRFDLELPEGSREALARDPTEYAPATLRYRGQEVRSIGVRLKGESTMRTLDEKPSFKLKFDKFEKGQRFFGLKRMTLNNDVQDPSFLSQSLAYQAFRDAGLPAPRCNHALVYVNGEFYGVYSNVETEDEVFLARFFASAEGNLYEEGGSDFVPGSEETFDLETNEKKNDRGDLTALIRALDEATPEDFLEIVGKEVDLDHYLTFAAVEALTGGEDGYSFSMRQPNNFRLYRDPGTDKFYFIPWGLDRALRPRFDPTHLHDWVPELERYRSPFRTRSLLLTGCIGSAPCKETYVARLREMADLFDAMDLASLARAQSSLIDPAVRADARKETGDDYVPYARQLLLEWLEERPDSLRNALGEE